MRKGQRKERELAERLAELGAKLDEIRARSSGTEELDVLT
jgi:Holliday junction resolvase